MPRVFDGHCDTILRCYQNGGGFRKNGGHLDLERMRAYGGWAQFFACFGEPEDMPGKPLWQVFQEEVDLFRRQMEENADLFVALDGGFGTLDEVMSALATMTFFQDPKPIHLLNRDGLYTPLKAMLETMAERRLASPEVAEAIQLHDDMASLIKALEKANAG